MLKEMLNVVNVYVLFPISDNLNSQFFGRQWGTVMH